VKQIKTSRFFFCPVKDPDTGQRCNRLLAEKDELFMSSYGMCSECFKKYNNHIDEIEEKVDNVVSLK